MLRKSKMKMNTGNKMIGETSSLTFRSESWHDSYQDFQEYPRFLQRVSRPFSTGNLFQNCD